MLETGGSDAGGYAAEVRIDAPRERVFEALTTLDGLAGWWVPDVTGSPEPGGQLTFSFGGERIVLQVDRAEAPTVVVWTCLEHSKFPEWSNTTLTFDLRGPDADSTALVFRHVGLVPALDCYSLCAGGWDHYLASLASHATGDGGTPWGSEQWKADRAARVG